MFGFNGRIGVIVPANNSALEPEMWPHLPEGVALYSTRALARGKLTPEAVKQMESNVDRAVEELLATGVDVVVFADMVTSFIMDANWNERRMAEIARRTGVPCLSAWTALKSALETLGIRRLALATPYPAAVHALGRPFFKREGFSITADRTLDIVEMSEVPKVSSERLRRLVRELDPPGAEAIVLLATDLPTFTDIEPLENEFGMPVLSSNQTLLWSALRTCGNTTEIAGLGCLFTH